MLRSKLGCIDCYVRLSTVRVVVVQAEARAEFAEKTVKKLQKEVDRLEGLLSDPCFITIAHYLGVDCCTTCTLLLGDNNALLHMHSRYGILDISACSYYFLQLSMLIHRFNSTSRFHFNLLFPLKVLLNNIQIRHFFIYMFSKGKKW